MVGPKLSENLWNSLALEDGDRHRPLMELALQGKPHRDNFRGPILRSWRPGKLSHSSLWDLAAAQETLGIDLPMRVQARSRLSAESQRARLESLRTQDINGVRALWMSLDKGPKKWRTRRGSAPVPSRWNTLVEVGAVRQTDPGSDPRLSENWRNICFALLGTSDARANPRNTSRTTPASFGRARQARRS